MVAGFGPFALLGGFGIDKQALAAVHDDERGARVKVLALGALEWAVLAPVGVRVRDRAAAPGLADHGSAAVAVGDRRAGRVRRRRVGVLAEPRSSA